ncbi:hypothetical protein OSTOST_10824 [Ostertagia ostertagi]
MENSAGERTVTIFGRVFPRDAFICRLFYLAFFASFGSLFPLLAVYFKQLGMTAAQAGMLLGCRPLVEFAAVPFWGSFASRFRRGINHRDLFNAIRPFLPKRQALMG